MPKKYRFYFEKCKLNKNKTIWIKNRIAPPAVVWGGIAPPKPSASHLSYRFEAATAPAKGREARPSVRSGATVT